MVGKVLAAQSDLGSPGPYIPTFYQLKEKMHIPARESSKELTAFHPQNALMQQPLAHLYFLTVFELLQTRKYHSNHLVKLAGKISVVGDYKCINFSMLKITLMHFLIVSSEQFNPKC